ncbi:putative helicase [Burkholderia pseudomallei]|uniref:MobH family relaxase n=1 Tax=Burkholderia pseudomallei TaxID=28450 RepID=UPI000F1F25CF|nr:MobH family relaxase [Burkholderia pseudomallei]CAJ3557274.1 putative helicase [Burkholderia pseudomallei]CAJ3597493.1 putative helicase [Burkholderia pseudomallei]CAJ3652101.1 putative helicase [Burkholderia pseudomallei]CAJ3793537.1 putative helicase [Burkholderia pseudomallei]CAJ3883559.1 putative helicase [Burkholderia pseudomallei]
MRFFSLFHRTTAPPAPSASPPSDMQKGLMQPQSAESLLALPRRQKLLEHICQRTSLSRAQFASLYRAPLERYAELVQQFPASESHHHAYPGGMLDHGLEIVAYALKLRQSHLLPVGASPETQAAQAEAWTAATAYAALLHDIGKIAVDLHVEYADGACWHPWHGPVDHPYRFRYRKDRRYRLHEVAAGLLYTTILDRTILDWLSTFPELWSPLLHVMAGHYEHAGVLGELVTQADQASVAQELGGNPQKALLAPKQALQRKLLDGLRHLVRDELKLNQPQASDGWLTQDALWLVSKTVADKLRAHLLAQGVEGIPDSNPTVFDVLQEHAIVQPTPEGKAIWKATVASSSGWTQSFTFLKLAPTSIWETDSQPLPFSGTVCVEQDAGIVRDAAVTAAPTSAAPLTGNTQSPPATGLPPSPAPSRASDTIDALLDLLGGPVPAPVEAAGNDPSASPPPMGGSDVPPLRSGGSTETLSSIGLPPTSTPPNGAPPSGEHFIVWLRDGIKARRLIINDAKALVHTVAGTVFLVSPGIFQRYAQEHPEVTRFAKQEQQTEWAWIQKHFERLGVHRKQNNGLNIWTCEVTGPRKSRRLHGYLLDNASSLFVEVPLNNPYLTLDHFSG